MNFIIEKEVQAEEMAKAVRHVTASSYLYWYLRIAGILFLLVNFIPSNHSNGNSFMVTGLILLAISFVLPYLLYCLNVKGTRKQLDGNSISFIYEFTNESIIINSHYGNNNSKSTIPATVLKKLKPCKEGIVIKLNSKKTIILYADLQQQKQILDWYNHIERKN